MVDPRTVRTHGFRLLFVFLTVFVSFLYLLPLRVGTGHWPGPDLILALSFAWVLRRPDYVPVFLVAAVMLIADFVFMRPPGLWSGLTVLGLEFLRNREPTSRDMPFAVEWAMVAGVMIMMAFLYRLVLAVVMVDQTSLGLTLLGQLSTILSYPLLAFGSRFALGMTKITPSEADEMGYAR